MTTVPQLAQTLQTVFTTTVEAAARATGFGQRRSRLTGGAFTVDGRTIMRDGQFTL
jgi:hypothetical protein